MGRANYQDPGRELGSKPGQAASGRHRHDGTDSVELLEGISITGNKTTINTTNLQNQINSVVAALVRLGATDART